MSDKPLQGIQNTKILKELWDKLNTRYAGAPTAKKINLFDVSHEYSISIRKSLGQYIVELEKYFNKLAAIGRQVKNKCRSKLHLCHK